MREFKKRRSLAGEWARVARGAAGILLLAALTFILARGAWNMYGKFAEAAEARGAAEADLESLQGQYTAVEAGVASLESPRGLEAEVRERYGVAKPGEGEIDIVRQATTTASAPAPHDTLWARLWRMLTVW